MRIYFRAVTPATPETVSQEGGTLRCGSTSSEAATACDPAGPRLITTGQLPWGYYSLYRSTTSETMTGLPGPLRSLSVRRLLAGLTSPSWTTSWKVRASVLYDAV